MLAGVPLNVVQKVMRHSMITLTIDTYGHLLPGAEAEAVDGLAAFFESQETMPTEALKTGTGRHAGRTGRSVCAVRQAGSTRAARRRHA